MASVATACVKLPPLGWNPVQAQNDDLNKFEFNRFLKSLTDNRIREGGEAEVGEELRSKSLLAYSGVQKLNSFKLNQMKTYASTHLNKSVVMPSSEKRTAGGE